MLKKYTVDVEIPADTQDECSRWESCPFLLNNFCTLFHEAVVEHDGHIYKLGICPASGERRYDE